MYVWSSCHWALRYDVPNPAPDTHDVTELSNGNSGSNEKNEAIAEGAFLVIAHRCPTYQLHLPPKTRFGNPKTPFQGNAGKFREIQGFRLNNIGIPKKGRSREFREIHSGDPKRAFWDDFPWRMRTAKVDMLGTGES